MTAIPDTHRDLLNSAVGVLATLGPDGQPQVTALSVSVRWHRHTPFGERDAPEGEEHDGLPGG